jgi:dipeptide transport system ATP-binding protein
MDETPLLSVRDLTVAFDTRRGSFEAVRDVSFDVRPGRTLGVVGESGSGKSVTAMALMRLLPDTARVTAGQVRFGERDLGPLTDRQMQSIRGRGIAMVFQDPMASLNPILTIGWQVMEPLILQLGLGRRAARARAQELLSLVRIPSPAEIMRAYPHELSGGMRQRVMIAIALSCGPKLLIADEPTTALDVTVQAQVLDLLLRLQRERDMALLLITHDLAVVAETAHRVVVMYAGQEVETGPLPYIFVTPRNPYTQALLAALPENNGERARLQAIPGVVPGAHDRPAGCLLSPRCRYAVARCQREQPALAGPPGRQSRCHFSLDAHGHPTNHWEAESRIAPQTVPS